MSSSGNHWGCGNQVCFAQSHILALEAKFGALEIKFGVVEAMIRALGNIGIVGAKFGLWESGFGISELFCLGSGSQFIGQ